MPQIQQRGVLAAPQTLFQRPPVAAPTVPSPRLNAVSQILNRPVMPAPDRVLLTTPRGIPTSPTGLRPLNLGSMSTSWAPAASSQAQVAVQWANHLLHTVRDNKYVLGGTQVDFDHGIVRTDCSGLMRALFKKVGVSLKGMNAAAMTRHIEDTRSPFYEIKKPAQFQTGDLVGVKMPKAKVSGHVMLAWGTPQPIVKNGAVVGYNLRILDSSSSHSDDSRKAGQSGIGTGVVSFKIDSQTGEVSRFYWKADFKGGSYPGSDVAVGRHTG